MSQIPFVNQLGDALEEAFITASPAPRRRPTRGRRWIVPAVVAVALAGGAAAASTLFNSTKLAVDGIGCYAGSGTGASQTFDVYGPSPIAACRRVFRAQHSPLGDPRVKLIACEGGPGPLVMVFKAQGQAQCHRLGLSSLPGSYAPAADRVAALDRALLSLVRGRDCVAPAELSDEVNAALVRLGWSGWRAKLLSSTGQTGACANLGFNSSGAPDPSGSLDATNRVVIIFRGQ
jgi:hypothetical protein